MGLSLLKWANYYLAWPVQNISTLTMLKGPDTYHHNHCCHNYNPIHFKYPHYLPDHDPSRPLERKPTSMSFASIMILGRRKQKAETRWMKGEVGPPWCHAFRIRPEDLEGVAKVIEGKDLFETHLEWSTLSNFTIKFVTQ